MIWIMKRFKGEIAMADGYIIEASHVGCKVGYRYLLHDINWQVKPGERWVVFGMNGSGKTTLLSIIAGFKHYTEGKVKIFGQEMNNDNILDIRRKIGWVSSSFFDKFYTKESALDIVLSGKYGTLGLSDGVTLEDRKLAKALLEELNLSEQMNYTFDMLSKGERQNVLIARALFPKPKILVLDEPCTGLDIYNREYLFKTIEDLAKKENMTIIYVTHYAEEISEIFDKCLLLKKGKVFTQGITDELFTDKVITELLGYPVEIRRDENKKIDLNVLDVQSNIMSFL